MMATSEKKEGEAVPLSRVSGTGGAGPSGAAGLRTKKPKRSSPLPEFCFYYFGTLGAFVALNHYGVLSPGVDARDLMPAEVHVSRMFGPVVLEKMPFVLLGMALVYPLHLWRSLIKSFFVPLAARGAGLAPGTLKHDKFLEQGWLAVHYLLVTCLEVAAVTQATDYWPPMLTARSREALLMPLGAVAVQAGNYWILATYLLQYTFYFMELATLFLDRNSRSRSDAFVYALHHVLTVFLISFSFLYTSQHIGLLVLLFHDTGDIFLSIAKCFVYSEDHARATYSKRTVRTLLILGVVFFVLFLVAFGFFRLVLLPALIYVLVYPGHWLGREHDIAVDGFPIYEQPLELQRVVGEPFLTARFVLVVALILLQPLHVYWFRLALRVAYKAVLGVYDDERSDDDEYDDDYVNKNKDKNKVKSS